MVRETLDRQRIRGWPPRAVAIAEAVGVDLALRVVERWGGGTLVIPKQAKGSALAEEIGVEAAERLIARLGHGRIEVPNLGVARSKKAVIAAATGSNTEVARRFNCTERYVRRVRNGGSL